MANKERYANSLVLNVLEATTWNIGNDLVLISVIFKDVVSNVEVM
jgi:hypothetical protein